jgi:hypothetical protein
MTNRVRRFWHRILAGSTPVLLESESEVRISEALEDSATYVAEFNVAAVNAAPLIGQPVTIDQVDLGALPGANNMRRQFTGRISAHQASGFPHQQTVRCVGKLALLRKRRQGTDYSLTGKTDIQAVKDLLTLCGVSYTASDIGGWGYQLGQIKPVYWRVGQQAIEVISELDRVFACATIELGNGRIVRFPYSKVPADYASGQYGAYNVQWRFIAGQDNVFFYNDERSRGAIDDIQNYWRVEGLRWTDSSNCERQIIAEAVADHPIYGAGFTAGPETFQSDFIQTEALAKAIAIRLMRWTNRIPDVVRIETANIATITPGDLISVLDPAQSLDLSTERVFVVTSVEREGDFMTIEAVGGDAGATGTVTSQIEVCCGTQREDGTCTNQGTNPGPASGPSPDVPANSGLGHCDPLADATCIPGVDYPLVDPPNIFDPLINCYTNGSLVADCGGSSADECHQGSLIMNPIQGSPPANICELPSTEPDNNWRPRTYLAGAEAGDTASCVVQVNWRTVTGTPIYRVVGGAVDAIGAYTGLVQIALNTQFAPNLQTPATDVTFGAPLLATISGTIVFVAPGSLVTIGFSPGPYVQFQADGFTVNAPGRPEETYAIIARTENEVPILVGTCPPNTSRGGLCRNNGGYMGSPGSGYVPFSVTFDESYNNGWGKTIVSSALGGGYTTHNDYLNPTNPLPGEPTLPLQPCASTHTSHVLIISLYAGSGSGSAQQPAVYITDLVVGYQTCEPNPNYVTVPSDMG